MGKVRIRLLDENESSSDIISCEIRCADDSLLGMDATLKVESLFLVKDSRAVNKTQELHRHSFRLTQSRQRVEIPRAVLTAYTYRGRKLDVQIQVTLKVNDSILFDTKVSEKLEHRLGLKPKISVCAKKIVDPKDLFSLRKNLNAISPARRVLVLFLVLLGYCIAGVNALIGVHDQFVPESQTYFYSHESSDGEGSSPLMNSLLGSGVLGAAVWAFLRSQLRRYMTFRIGSLPNLLRPQMELQLRDLIRGKPRVDLHEVTLRVVAANMEHGQYIRGSGSNQRTVSFEEPVNGIVLFSRDYEFFPAGRNINTTLEDSFSLQPLFETLYPPQSKSSTHGVFVYWEVQLLHKEFIDQEAALPIMGLRYEDFLHSGDEYVKESEKQEAQTPLEYGF